MTKQHFEMVARVVSQIADTEQRALTAWAFVREFEQANVRFDAKRFLAACGTVTALHRKVGG